MNRSSVIPTRRRRWPHPLLLLAAACMLLMTVSALRYEPPSEAARREAAIYGYDQGFADAMNQVADTVGAAYATGYRTAQREAAATCSGPKGAPL